MSSDEWFEEYDLVGNNIQELNKTIIQELLYLTNNEMNEESFEESDFIGSKVILIRKNVNETSFILGFLSYIMYDSYNYIMIICINKQNINRGYASKLLEYYLWKHPVEQWVKINKNNIASISLFKKYGFYKRWKKHTPKQLKASYRTEYYPWFLPKRISIDCKHAFFI